MNSHEWTAKAQATQFHMSILLFKFIHLINCIYLFGIFLLRSLWCLFSFFSFLLFYFCVFSCIRLDVANARQTLRFPSILFRSLFSIQPSFRKTRTMFLQSCLYLPSNLYSDIARHPFIDCLCKFVDLLRLSSNIYQLFRGSAFTFRLLSLRSSLRKDRNRLFFSSPFLW